MTLLIERARIVTGAAPDGAPGAPDGVLEDHDILVEGDRIAAIGPDLARRRGLDPAPDRIIDARGLIAFPGLVNAHLHSNESFEQGMSDNLPLELWRLRTYPPFGVPPLDEEDFRLRALMAGIQSIRSGVTTVQDDVINLAGTTASVDGACRAYAELGLRAWVTTSLGDRGLLDSHPFLAELITPEVRRLIGSDRPMPARDQIALFEANHARWDGAEGGRIRIILGPRAPQRCTPELLALVGEASERHGCPIHTHALETRTQAVTAQRELGRTLIAYLDDLGLLSPRLTLNHGIWLTDDDIARLGAAGCAVTHNPLSNQKLGSGICRVRRLLDEGVTVALGTDGLATSDTADMLTALHAGALLNKLSTPDPARWASAADAFVMATRGGAASGGMADDLGRLASGMKADIALFDRRHWGFVPCNDPVAQLAYSVGAEAADTVIVDGEPVMRHRRLTRIDEEAVRAAVIERAERWRAEIKPKAIAAADTLTPAMTAMYERAMADFATADWAAPLRR